MRHIFKGLLFSVLFWFPLELPANAAPLPVTDVATRTLPAVVVIIGETDFFDRYYGNLSGWGEYFRPFYNYLWPSENSMGSGCIISAEGHIVTNEHVIKDMAKILVVLQSDDTWQLYPTSLLGAGQPPRPKGRGLKEPG